MALLQWMEIIFDVANVLQNSPNLRKKNNEKTTYENKKRKKTGKKLEETVIWQTTHDKLHS